jgi:thioesterase domain-containing protein
VVGHLLRELESAIRDVLLPLIQGQSAAAASGPGKASQQPEPSDHKQEIDAIATALGFPSDDELRRLWKSLKLHSVAHRGSQLRPRPVDDEFRAWWDGVQALLLRLGRQFESTFTASLPLIDHLAGMEQPTRDDDLTRLGSVPHSVVALERFFDRAGPGWFHLLRRKGYLSNPPALELAEDGTIAYARWPAGRYLARMAAEPSVRDDLLKVLLAETTDNPEAHESTADAALALPVGAAARLAPKIAEFLTTPYQWALPFKARDLVIRLADAGEAAAALVVLRPIVQAETEREWWRSAGVLREVIPAAFPQLGLEGLELIAEALDMVLDERRPGARDWRDYSTTWRPNLDDSSERDREDTLVSALRDTAVRLAQAAQPGVGAVVQALEQRDRAIFHRVALHVLRVAPDEQLSNERLSQRRLFDDALVEREYTLLLREHGAIIPDNVRRHIVEWIDAGPQDSALETEAVDSWRLHQLDRFGDKLPSDQIGRRDELVARYGTPIDPWEQRRFWWGDRAPLTIDELLALDDDDLVDVLRTWQPDKGPFTPSREGLRQNLEEATARAAGRFANLARAFAGLHPAYASGLISGLRKATNEKTAFSWAPVLELCRDVLAGARSESDSTGRPADEQESGWADVRTEIARLLGDGLHHDAVPDQSADEVFDILAELASNPDPTRDGEQRHQAAGDAWPLDLNTTRGTAFHALMQYAWWRKRQASADEEPHLSPQLRNLLDRHLDPNHEPTETIRSVYGQYFPSLMACDQEWARSRVDAIFSTDPSLERLRAAAWDSYLLFNSAYPRTYELLREHYGEAVSRLGVENSVEPSERVRQTREALTGHILGLYVRGAVDLQPGSLVDLFLSRAPASMRANLIDLVGYDLTSDDNQPSERAVARLQQLWEWRVSTPQGDDEHRDLDDLEGFGLWFASGRFDAGWALNQLHELLTAGGSIDPHHGVIERLAALRRQHLTEVVACLALVIEAAQRHTPPRPWFVAANYAEIRDILEDGTTADDQATRTLTQQTVNRLIARGHAQFGDLLAS